MVCLGLRETRSTTLQRLSILLLIAALATFIICVYGHACQFLKLHYQYQTNSIKHRAVLSWSFLGLLTLKEQLSSVPRHIIQYVINTKICMKVLYAE